MTYGFVDLRTFMPAMLKPHRNKPWTLPDEEPIGSFRELLASQVRDTIREEDMVGDILARFWARHRCAVCGQFGYCMDRDRTADLRLIVRREGR